MTDCGDLPPIPPERRIGYDRALKELLYPPKGKLLLSRKMAKRLADRIYSNIKKDPTTVQRIVRSLGANPELDALVAKELEVYKK